MSQLRTEIIAWVGNNVVPHEADLRARLRRMGVSEDDVHDIVQDAYVSISKLKAVSHIQSGRAYLFATARSVLLQRLRRERIVRIDTLSEFESATLADQDPGPERSVSARHELRRVQLLIQALPEPCRQIFELRRVHGVPQREVAARLGIPEHTVEAQAARGLKLILKAIAGDQAPSGERVAHRRGA